MAIEEPRYAVESKTDSYEIRKYEATLVAETKVEAKFDDAGNLAFRILADYIFGNNKSKTKLAMTAPVTQQPPSEKISMTAPVNQIPTQGGFLVQFTMPAGFTPANIPEPNDARVHLRMVPPRRVAVYSYSGSWSESRYTEKLAAFLKELQKNGMQTTGGPIFARFNSPFVPWFLRRNEIWLELV
ncbi:MAG: heme-binding protein [Methylotenera sp.]|nr:heme-binding protein [Oligoflexia bacterium]